LAAFLITSLTSSWGGKTVKFNVVLKSQLIAGETAQLAPVTALDDHREKRIRNVLETVVCVKGRANVLMKELFSPLCGAAVVIRRKDGSYMDPCDFGSYVQQKRHCRWERPQCNSLSQTITCKERGTA